MEEIIKKAIEGGYSFTLDWDDKSDLIFPLLDPLFWQALGKACGWSTGIDEYRPDEYRPEWIVHYLYFHELNLTKDFDSAVDWLTELIKK